MSRVTEPGFEDEYYFKESDIRSMRFGEFKPMSEAEYHDGYGRGEDINTYCCYERDPEIHNGNRTDIVNEDLFREIELSDW
jgi:hypothetical protein